MPSRSQRPRPPTAPTASRRSFAHRRIGLAACPVRARPVCAPASWPPARLVPPPSGAMPKTKKEPEFEENSDDEYEVEAEDEIEPVRARDPARSSRLPLARSRRACPAPVRARTQHDASCASLGVNHLECAGHK